jgi:hypothetical protein
VEKFTKVCTKCKETKELEEFAREKRCKEGRRPNCRQCRNLAAKNTYHTNPIKREKLNARSLSWHKNNREKALKHKSEHARTGKARYTNCKTRAKKGNIYFDLTFEQWKALTSSEVCHYDSDHKLPETGGSLDRKNNDPEIGYRFYNCVPCCAYCNKTKGSNITYEEFVNLMNNRKSKAQSEAA